MNSDSRLYRCLLCATGAARTVYFPASEFPGEELGFEIGLCERHDSPNQRFRALRAARAFRMTMRRAMAIETEAAA